MKDNDGPKVMIFKELHYRYAEAELVLFASSCENISNILLETMVSGLPIAFPNRREMPEFLGNSVVYFDSEQPVKVDHDLYEMVESPPIRVELDQENYQGAVQHPW